MTGASESQPPDTQPPEFQPPGEDEPATDGPATATAAGQRRPSAMWAWAVLLVSVVVLAVSVPVYRARSSTRTVVSVVTASPTAAPARDCEVGFGQCAVRAGSPAVRRAVIRHFPGAVVLDAYSLDDGTRVATESVEVRTRAQVGVSVRSQCAGGVASVPDRSYGDAAAYGPAHRVIVAGGPNGCSVAVVLDVPKGAAVPAAAGRALAHDPALVLP